MILLINKELESYAIQEKYYICREEFKEEDTDDKKYHRARDHCCYIGKYRGAANGVCNLKYSTPKAIPVVFHNG